MENENDLGVEVLDPNDEHREPEAPATETQPKPKKPEVSPEVREMRRALRETSRALKMSNDRLAALENGGGSRKPEQVEEEEEKPLSVDLVEAITNGDTKAVKQALRELGFVDGRTVDQKLSNVVQTGRSEQNLIKDFPDLADENSDFFQTTARIYKELERDPALAKSGKLAEIAAKLADRELGGSGEGRRRDRRDRTDDFGLDREFDADEDDDDEERERVERVRRQSGDRGRRSSGSRDQRDSDQLDQTQKMIVSKLRAAGADISEDGYRKRAQKGVRMSGLPARRPRY